MTYNFSDIKVLVVEESQPMSQITNAILKGFGINYVESAQNSDIAFEKFCKEQHDLLLIDWIIKPIDGIALTEKIRMDAHSPNPFVPIILMTGLSEKRRVMQARDTGITEFMVKPYTVNDLYRRLDHIIQKPRQFVKSPDFFGPDRRRKMIDEEDTPKRRAADAIDD